MSKEKKSKAEAKETPAKAIKKLPVEAQAWNNTKLEGDPEWKQTGETEFWGKLQFAADRVKATGTAQTNYEQEVLRLFQEEQANKKDEGPMAVSNPNPSLSFGPGAGAMAHAAAAGGTPSIDAASGPQFKSNKSTKPASSKAKSKSKPPKVAPDNSGHVIKGKEASSAAREQGRSPRHP